jgi:DNA-binding CsgD family transcriptional regulator
VSAHVEHMTDLTSKPAIRGRDRELTLLSELLNAARSSFHSVAVVGEAGQGKTVLLDAAVDVATSHGTRVMSASGIEAESDLPFAALHQLVGPSMDHAERLPARQRAALDAALGVSQESVPERFMVGLALLTLLSEIADERPVLIAIDDVPWVDRGSIDAIAFATRRLQAESIALIVTARPDHDLAPFGPHLSRLDLDPLDRAAAAAILDDAAPHLSRRHRSRILDDAAGNPLAVVEFARGRAARRAAAADDAVALAPTERLEQLFAGRLGNQLLEPLCRREQLFAGRLGNLPDKTRRALVVAAACDAGDTATLLRAAGSMGLWDHFGPAERDALIAVGVETFRFRHPILRSVIYHSASQADRRAAHQALATALAASPERAAWHLASVASEPDDAIAAALETAAERARARGGFGAATRAMRRAAMLSTSADDRARRLAAAVALAFLAGETSTVLELDRELRGLTNDPVVLGQASLWVAQVEVLRGEGRASAALSIPAVAALLPADPASAIGLMAVAAGYAYLDGDRATAAALDGLIKSIPGDGSEPWRLYILAAVDPVGNAPLVRPHIDAIVNDVHAPEALLRVTSHIPWYLDDHAAAATLLVRYLEAARTEGQLGALASYVVPLALVDVWHGRLSDAVMHATEGVRVGLEVDQPAMAAVGIGVVALVAALRGEREALHAHAEGITAASGALARALTVWSLGLDALASGRPDAAYGHLHRLFDADDPAAHRDVARWAIGDLVEAGLGAEIVDELEALTAESERLAAIAGAIRTTMVTRRARAVLDDGPADAFDAALSVEGAPAWPFDLARARLAYGTWLRRHRQIVAAREPLRAAADTFEQLGADPWEARAKAELRAAGEASSVRLKAYDDELTPQQRQVAQLAARGLSNREIGAQLYLSPRTVSFHLYNIFPKLGVTTRSQLAATIGGELDRRASMAAHA